MDDEFFFFFLSPFDSGVCVCVLCVFFSVVVGNMLFCLVCKMRTEIFAAKAYVHKIGTNSRVVLIYVYETRKVKNEMIQQWER